MSFILLLSIILSAERLPRAKLHLEVVEPKKLCRVSDVTLCDPELRAMRLWWYNHMSPVDKCALANIGLYIGADGKRTKANQIWECVDSSQIWSEKNGELILVELPYETKK